MLQFLSLLACFPLQKDQVQYVQLPGQLYFVAAKKLSPDIRFFILKGDTPLLPKMLPQLEQ